MYIDQSLLFMLPQRVQHSALALQMRSTLEAHVTAAVALASGRMTAAQARSLTASALAAAASSAAFRK